MKNGDSNSRLKLALGNEHGVLEEEIDIVREMYLLTIFILFLGPYIVSSRYKYNSEYVDDQRIELLNFSITIIILHVLAYIFKYVFIGFIIFPFIILYQVIYLVVGRKEILDGVKYRFPFNIRLLK